VNAIRGLLLILIVGTTACATSRTEQKLLGAGPCGAVARTGTFSDLRAVPPGVMRGTEVRLVLVNEVDLQASFQFAEADGSLSGLVVADVHDKYENWPVGVPYPPGVSGSQEEIWSELPEPHPGRFEGLITPAGLKGTIRFASGRVLKLDLPRSYSYWE